MLGGNVKGATIEHAVAKSFFANSFCRPAPSPHNELLSVLDSGLLCWLLLTFSRRVESPPLQRPRQDKQACLDLQEGKPLAQTVPPAVEADEVGGLAQSAIQALDLVLAPAPVRKRSASAPQSPGSRFVEQQPSGVGKRPPSRTGWAARPSIAIEMGGNSRRPS
ncbi:hypothetical protein CDD83_6915 [Cordyceps sp. RAO-2017]|nr:hypothetical protein CDD83_6915 [Cordyceps sp. RAO-2017]